MKKGSKKAQMSIMDAVDNLSTMAELDVKADEAGVKSKLQKFKNLKHEDKENTLNTVKGTFKTVHKYLEHIYSTDKEHLKDAEMQRGVKAIMVLAGEAAEKLESCTSLFKHTFKEGKIAEIKEFKELKKFFKNKIVKRFKEGLAAQEAWEEEWSRDDVLLDIEKLGLKDLETVKRDREYELFYIRKDDGTPFFNHNLLRHIKLVSDFDEVISSAEGDDPLLRVNVLADLEVQALADEIRESAKAELEEFYADALKHQEIPIIRLLNKITMSLLLASNPKNLQQHAMGKTCTGYFRDFQVLLREILKSKDYLRLIAHSLSETDRLSRSLVHLIHAYCHAFFVNVGRRKDLIQFIHDLIKKGYNVDEVKQDESCEPIVFWNELFEIHDVVTSVLKRYPSGPLFKTIDIFKDRDEKEGFDPLFQGNRPTQAFHFSSESFDSICLRIPCPTFHDHINKARTDQEFKGFLRHLSSKKLKGTLLVFNLQDRTSWEEHARCQELEDLQSQAEFSKQFILVTIPKRTDFYRQTDNYKELDSATDFMKLIKEQIALEEECGFFFSRAVDGSEIQGFVKKVLPLIHKQFFGKKVQLNRKDRLDFIEIFYQLLMLKILDLVKPDYFSFTCKDAVDTGPTTSAGFFAMIKMMGKEKNYSKEEQDHFLWVLYGPALMNRERLVDYQKMSRVLSGMNTFHEALKKDEKGILKVLEALYDYPLFQNLKIT